MGGGGWGLHSELTSFEGTRKRPPHVRNLQTLAFWVAACWRLDCIIAFPGLETASSLHYVADAPAFIPILHWIKKQQQGLVEFSQELLVQFVLSAIHLLWTSCSRRLAGRRGDRKENSTIFYPFPLVLSTFPPVTLVFTLDIPPILLSLKKSKMASADKLNDHSPEKLCVYHRLPKLQRNSWYTRLSSSKT